jgi:hypothetical protein
MPSKDPKNLMDEDKKDTPPAHDVRWEVSCNERTRESREQKGEISRHVKVIVSARTWVDAKERAFREFASAHQIYEPEDVEAFILRDAAPLPMPVPMTDAGAPPPMKAESDDVPIRDEKGQLLSPMVIAATAAIKKDRRKKKAVKDKEETP